MPNVAKYDAKEIAEYCRSNTWQDAAMVFGCSRSTVTNACEAHGVMPLNKAAVNRKHIAAWVEENESTVTDAVQHFRCSRDRIIKACEENGVVPSPEKDPYSRPVPRTSFEILAELIRGHSTVAIADEFGVSKQRVHQIKERGMEAGFLGVNAFIELKRDAK